MSILDKITEKRLKDWAGWKAFRDGQSLYERGVVEKITTDGSFVTGMLNLGPRGMRSRFEVLSNGLVENHCPCRDNQERGLICAHLVAMGLQLIDQKQNKNSNKRVDRIARGARGIRVRRARKSTPGAIHAKIILELCDEWQEEVGKYYININILMQEKNRKYPITEIKPDQAIYLNRNDNELLQVLESFGSGNVKSNQRYSILQFVEIIKCCSSDTLNLKKSNSTFKIDNKEIMTVLKMDLDRENGEIILDVLSENFLDDSLYLLGDKNGWIYSNNCFYFLKNILPNPYRQAYNTTLRISRNNVPSFLMGDLVKIEKDIEVSKSITSDLFYMKPDKPSFRLHIKGSAASIAAKLYAIYDDGYELIAGRADRKGNFAIPDPRDLLKYRIRRNLNDYLQFLQSFLKLYSLYLALMML